jgi:hypothetical protein
MKQLISKLKGDKDMSFVAYWLVFVYACFSASSNLAYLGHERNGYIRLFSKTFYMYVSVLYLRCTECSYHYFRAISKMAFARCLDITDV